MTEDDIAYRVARRPIVRFILSELLWSIKSNRPTSSASPEVGLASNRWGDGAATCYCQHYKVVLNNICNWSAAQIL